MEKGVKGLLNVIDQDYNYTLTQCFFSSSEAFILFSCNANIKWIASFVINAFLKEVT